MIKAFGKEVKNAFWLIGGRVVQMMLSLLVSLLTARYLGPSNFGLINYAASYVAFFTSFCNLGLNYVLIKDFIVYPEQRGVAIGTSIVMRALSSFISIILIILVSSKIDGADKETVGVVALCSLAVFFNVFDTLNYWFQVQYKSKVTSIVTLIAYTLVSVYRLILLILKKNVFWFAMASSIDSAIIGLLLFFAFKLMKGPRLSVSIAKGKLLLSNSYHYILSGMMVTIYSQTDKFMLKKMLSNSEVGYYSVSVAICTAWVFVLTAIIDSLFPTICTAYKEDRAVFEKKNRQLYCIIFYISVSVSIIITCFAEYLIRILYGDVFLPSVGSLRIVTWYTAFAYLGVARNAWLVCENKQKYEKYIYSVAVVFNVLANFLLIPKFHSTGAAIASCCTQLFTLIVLPLFIKELRPNVKLIVQAIFLKRVFTSVVKEGTGNATK